MRNNSIFAFLALVILSSCNIFGGKRINGNGNVVTETHDLTGFTEISVGGAIDLYISQGSSYSIKVVTDENLHEFVSIRKDGDELEIRPEHNMNLNGSSGIKVYVTCPTIHKLGASGASDIVAETALQGGELSIDLSGASSAKVELDYTDVDLELSGASSAELRGNAKRIAIEGSGASEVKAMDLTTADADVDISGASNVSIFVTESLKAEASGASEIVHSGGARVNSNTSGASSVRAK
ncbi:MAG: DUF2807 domain-containing protein [Chitinophagaceae bacterium]|nr:DUF2807 domain-containing protein [Chitinophagaceae bacterium]